MIVEQLELAPQTDLERIQNDNYKTKCELTNLRRRYFSDLAEHEKKQAENERKIEDIYIELRELKNELRMILGPEIEGNKIHFCDVNSILKVAEK